MFEQLLSLESIMSLENIRLASSVELMAIIAIVSSLLQSNLVNPELDNTRRNENSDSECKKEKFRAFDQHADEVISISIGEDALPLTNFQKVSLRNQKILRNQKAEIKKGFIH